MREFGAGRPAQGAIGMRLTAIGACLVLLAPFTGDTRSAPAAAPSSAPGHASFLVTLSGTIAASSQSTSSSGMIDTTTSLRYRWSETLRETVAAGTERVLRRSVAVNGKGRVGIVVVDHRTYGENHSLSCSMSLRPDASAIGAKEPPRLSFDAIGAASATGLVPVDLVRAIYTGPPQLNGLAPPCFSADPYGWTVALAIPLQQKPQAPPFEALSCDLGRNAGSLCKQPLSIRMSWPSATGKSSLVLLATLTARRLPPLASA